jgi:hypothetical protein
MVLLLLLAQPQSIKAQDTTASTTQVWLFWHYNHFFTNRIRYIHDIGYRQEMPRDAWSRIYYRPGIEYSAWSIVDLIGGVGFWYTIQEHIPDAFEIRPWQGLKFDWPSVGRFEFDHYIRLEERFNYSIGNGNMWTFALRGAYRINLTLPINHPGIIDKTFFVRVNAAFYMDLGKSIEERFVNDERYTAGLGYRFNPKWRFELLYSMDRSKAFSTEGFKVNSHIIKARLRTYILPRT